MARAAEVSLEEPKAILDDLPTRYNTLQARHQRYEGYCFGPNELDEEGAMVTLMRALLRR